MRPSTFYLLFTFIGMATFPIYLLPSGSIQISHAFLLLPSLFILISPYESGRKKHQGYKMAFIWLLLWIWVRQTIYSFQVQELKYLPALFFTFNVMIAYFVVNIVYRYKHKAITVVFYATLCGLLIALVFSQIGGSSLTMEGDTISYRTTGSFNNPNQLGYFSVCCAGILALLWLRFHLNTAFFYLGFAICILLAITSLSKAAMVGIVMYLPVFISRDSKYRIWGYLGMLGAFFMLISTDLSKYKFFYRLENMSKENDGLMTRGYALLFDMEWSLLYGEGEGYAKTVASHAHEFHSTFGNVFLSYGLIGFLPVIYIFWYIFNKLRVSHSVMVASALLLPFCLYGITHNGARATMAWIFLSLCYASINIPRQKCEGVR